MTDDSLIASIRTKLAATIEPKLVAIASERRLPATLEIVLAAEKKLGRDLDSFLRRAYLEVTNGGFGPGYGALALSGADSMPSTYESVVGDRWPAELLPVWDWGCAMWSCVDSVGKIVTQDGVNGPTLTSFDVRSWLQAWADGVNLWKELYDDVDAEIMNPFTRKPVKTKRPGKPKGRPWTPPETKL